MGIFDTVITLTALGVGAYFTVYYLIPALNQLNANAQTPAPAPYIPPPAAAAEPYIPPEADVVPDPEPIADVPEDTISDEEKSDLVDAVQDLKDLVEENEKKDEKKKDEKKKPKKEEETLSDMIEKATKPKKGGSTVENEAAPKKKAIAKKGGTEIENEAAYASIINYHGRWHR